MLPDSATLEEVAIEIVTSVYGSAIARHSRNAVLMVQFIRWDRGPEEPMDYACTLGEFRTLANRNLAKVVISDGSGGVPAKIPEPVG